MIEEHPIALQLRYLQTLLELGASQATTIVFPAPIDLFKPFLERAVTDLRTDPLTGRRVAIAPARAKRPGAARAELEPPTPEELEQCPFCAGREDRTPPETLRLGDPWRVRVVPEPLSGVRAPGGRRAHAAPRALACRARRRRARPRRGGVAAPARGVPAGYLHALVNEGREAGVEPAAHALAARLASASRRRRDQHVRRRRRIPGVAGARRPRARRARSRAAVALRAADRSARARAGRVRGRAAARGAAACSRGDPPRACRRGRRPAQRVAARPASTGTSSSCRVCPSSPASSSAPASSQHRSTRGRSGALRSADLAAEAAALAGLLARGSAERRRSRRRGSGPCPSPA